TALTRAREPSPRPARYDLRSPVATSSGSDTRQLLTVVAGGGLPRPDSPQRWALPLAHLAGPFAARTEGAAGRQGEQAGRGAGDGAQIPARVGDVGHGAQERR